MSVKILLLRTNEEVICEVKEITEKDNDSPVGYHLHKPFRLEIVQNDIELNRQRGYQVSWFPWAPLSKDKDYFLPYNFVVTAYDPLDSITVQYLSAIQEEKYEKNFQRHEEYIAGGGYSALDMEELFEQAEQMLEDEDGDGNGDTTDLAEDGNVSDQSCGADGHGTELPPVQTDGGN
jgi:hypothetical protein